MGYYANGNGTITFRQRLKPTEKAWLEEVLRNEWFEIDLDDYENRHANRPDETMRTTVSFYADEKYHDDSVRSALAEIAKRLPIAEGELEYAGEDGAHWRFLFRCGTWICQNGRIVYDDE